jgi:radical SAM protein with 4Fe4S-binding SPASM domain
MCLVTFSWEKPKSLEKIKAHESRKQVTWAHVELTNLCNFKCKWCYAGSGHNQNYTHLSKENASKLIKILANSGIKQITCSGGEPLMFPHIRDFIEQASDQGMIVHINTNGYFLTKKLASELKDVGLSQVQINIDSLNPKKHDSIRGKKGSFEKSIEALKNAIDVGITAVSQTVITRQNKNEVFDIIKFAREELGVQRCRIWDVTPSGTALYNTDLIPTGYIELLKKIAEFTADLGAKHILSYEPLFPINYQSPLDVTHIGCPSSKGMLMHIFTNGWVYYCCTLRNKIMYNVLDYENIIDIHKSKIKEFNESLLNCSKCHLQKCGGGCPSRIMSTGGEWDYQCL